MSSHSPGEIGYNEKALVYYDSQNRRRVIIASIAQADSGKPPGTFGIEAVDGTDGGRALTYVDFVNDRRSLLGDPTTGHGLDPKQLALDADDLVWATVDGNERQIRGDRDEALLPDITVEPGNDTEENSVVVTVTNFDDIVTTFLRQGFELERITTSEHSTSHPQGAIEDVSVPNGLTGDDVFETIEDTHDFEPGAEYYYRVVNRVHTTTTGPVQGEFNPATSTGPDAHWVGPVAPGMSSIDEQPLNGTWHRLSSGGSTQIKFFWEHPAGASYPYISVSYFNSGGSPRTNTGPLEIAGDETSVLTYDSGQGIIGENEEIEVRVCYTNGTNVAGPNLIIDTSDSSQEHSF